MEPPYARHDTAHSGGKARHVKKHYELSGRTENNRVVNFEGTPEMIGKSLSMWKLLTSIRTPARKSGVPKMKWGCAMPKRRSPSLPVPVKKMSWADSTSLNPAQERQ